MPCWTSPWPVAAPLDAHLRAAGLKRCEERLEALPEDALILYFPPDALLAAGMASAQDPPTPQQLATTYRQLQTLYGRHRLISAWRLQGLTPEGIRQWLVEASPPLAPQPFPEPEPLSALLARTLIEGHPHLLEAYLDLELIAELAGGAPDTAYARRLNKAIADSRALLEHCWLPHQRNQALRQDIADQSAREDALASESQRAREAETLMRAQLDHAREAQERLTQATHDREARLAQLEQTLASQVSRLLRLEADLQQVNAERAEALATVADLQPQLAAREEELRRSREAEAVLVARMEELAAENRGALAEAEQRLRQVQDESEQLFLDGQSQRARILQLEETIAAREEALRLPGEGKARESAGEVVLEPERKAWLKVLEATAEHRQGLEREQAVVLTREIELRRRLVAVEQEAAQSRDAEVRLLDRLGQLEATITAQSARLAQLEANEQQLRGERDQALRQREEISQQARSSEADLLAQVQAMEIKTGQASQEARRLTGRLHETLEEMEQIFLQGRAGQDLIAAQHLQLQRAQSLMSRLLVQSTRSLMSAQAVAVEVLPAHAPKAISGSTSDADPARPGPAGRLLRRIWTP